jgi:hypothetical protein
LQPSERLRSGFLKKQENKKGADMTASELLVIIGTIYIAPHTSKGFALAITLGCMGFAAALNLLGAT